MTASAALTSQACTTHDDLRAIESIVSAAWASPARPLVNCTIGDLEWWVAGAGPGVDWSERLRLWSIGGDPVGWGWFKPPGDLDWFVRPSLAPADEDLVRDEILDWGIERARTASAPLLEVWGADGWREAARLLDRGWTPTDVALSQFLQPLDRRIERPAVPSGYRVRTMAGPDEIPARVEVHRAAFAPSKLTVEKYAICVGQEHYAFERDVVVEAPDGSFAAFTMCWFDPVGSIGEFEPVGTHPDHRRRGLGRAANLHGLRVLQDAGARDALVFSLRSNAASEALYRSVGFREIAVHRQYTRPVPG
ncbi:MAG TPA: N-acetyltransferase [Candidatus Limnocylindrales bacterium]|nr:N-acetyltransferase [Candidatus Limnocylindrales bacterium]